RGTMLAGGWQQAQIFARSSRLVRPPHAPSLKERDSRPICQVDSIAPRSALRGFPCLCHPERPIFCRNRGGLGEDAFHFRPLANAAINPVGRCEDRKTDQTIK